MTPSWLRLLGVDAASIPEGARAEFVWTHAPASWGVFVGLAAVAALVYVAVWLYRREMTVCPRGVRMLLAGLRVAAIVVLALVFMGPALAVSVTRTLHPYVILLLDDSQSMGIRDAYDEPTSERLAEAAGADAEALAAGALSRAELVDRVLARDGAKLLRDLQARGQVRVMTFADAVRVREAYGVVRETDLPAEADAPAGPVDPLPPLAAAGARTDLGRALSEALASVAGHPVAGIVLVTDGQNAGGADPLAAAEQAAAREIPVMAVGVGDPRPPRNLRVVDVWAPETVFAGDPCLIQARLQSEGLEAGPVAVELVEDSAGEAEGRVLESRMAILGGGRSQADVTFEHTPTAHRRHIYTVRIPVQPRELLAADNEKSARVNVVTERARVLLVAGSPGWDFRMVRSLLLRDATIEVSCWLQTLERDMRQDGNTVIERLPSREEDLFAYDVVLMLDPDPSEFNEAWIDGLRRFMGDHAGGLLWMAGPKFTPKFLSHYRTRGIRDLLPVRVEDVSAAGLTAVDKTATRSWRMEVTPAGLEHPLLRFVPEADLNRRLLEALPGVYQAFPALGPKPGALVLAEHGDPRAAMRGTPRPLVVAGRYGAGRSLYLGSSGTWRWRKLGEHVFDQFWVQAVRYLVEGRLMGGKKRARLTTDRDVYPVGARVAVTAEAYSPAFEPIEVPALVAVVRARAAAPREIELRAVPGRPGRYEGAFVADRVGTHELEIVLRDDRVAAPARVTCAVTVEAPRLEFADPRLNKALLAEIAARTGGRYVELDTIDKAVAALPRRTETVVVRDRPRALWDTSRLLVLLVGLLAVEWAVRKRFRLM